MNQKTNKISSAEAEKLIKRVGDNKSIKNGGKMKLKIIFILIVIYWVVTNPINALAQSPEWKVYKRGNTHVPIGDVTAIAIDKQGNKWFCSRNTAPFATNIADLIKFDNNNWTNYKSPSHFQFNKIAIDAQGIKWMASFLNGHIIKFDDKNFTEMNKLSSFFSFNHKNIMDFVIDTQGNLWFCYVAFGGTQGLIQSLNLNRGLLRFDGSNWITYDKSNSGLPDSPTFTIAIDTLGNKWIGTGEGMVKFDGTNCTDYNASNSGLTHNDFRSIIIDQYFGNFVITKTQI